MEKQSSSKSFTYIPTEENKDKNKQIEDPKKQIILPPKLKWTAIILSIISIILYSIGAFVQIHFQRDTTALYALATICLLPLAYCLFKICRRKPDL